MALVEEKEMSEKEEIRDLFLRYGIEMPRRFRRNEKDAFCNAAGKEFQKNGYPVKAIAGTYKVRAVDVAANDLKKAENIIIANYDTPMHNFGNPFSYYPLNGPSSVKASTLPYYTPQIICMLVAVFFMIAYVGKIDFAARPLFSVIVTAAVFACCILGYILSTAFGNKCNMNRNTSGCVGAMRISALLKDAKNKTAFVLTDYGCSRHTGDNVLRHEIPDTIDHKQIIYLDCIGNGDTTMVGYTEGHKKQAEKLAACIHAKLYQLTPAELKYTSFSYYPSGLLVTRGFYKEESKIVSIPDTATKQDDTVDPDLVEELCQGIASYLEKEPIEMKETKENNDHE
jgi:hypothetical protein